MIVRTKAEADAHIKVHGGSSYRGHRGWVILERKETSTLEDAATEAIRGALYWANELDNIDPAEFDEATRHKMIQLGQSVVDAWLGLEEEIKRRRDKALAVAED